MADASYKHFGCPVVILRVVPTEVRGDELGHEMREEAVAIYTPTGAVNVVVDFAGVTFVSSAGVRPLLALQRLVKARGGRLILCNLHENVREMLDVTRMLRASGITSLEIEAQPDVPSAVAALYAAPPA
jgi:anti-anti-sigma factor